MILIATCVLWFGLLPQDFDSSSEIEGYIRSQTSVKFCLPDEAQ